METPGVAEVRVLLPDLEFVDPTWEGTAFVPFWGKELDVAVYPDEGEITSRQIDILRAVLAHTGDLRPAFEAALLEYYRAEIAEDSDFSPDAGPSEVWELIDDPVVCIPAHFRTESAIEFELSFNCEWDPEHGLGVLFRDWQPVRFGGWDL